MKILATTIGETGGDAVTMSMLHADKDAHNGGYLIGTGIFMGVFVAAVIAQIVMRGIDGAPGDGVRQTGFEAVLKENPGIKVVATTFMDWSNEKAAQQMSAMLASGKHFDGVWTSGIDYTVIEAIKAAHKPFVPFVGADNNGFIKQLIDYKKDGLLGVAVSNSPAIGAAGLVVALDVLQKKNRDRVTTVPTAWYDNTTDENVEKLKALYDPNVAPTDPVYGPEKDYGHFTAAQEKACKGPGE